ncbi:MAG: FAD/NAD(P)-binding protein [Mycobacteriales bacterium]
MTETADLAPAAAPMVPRLFQVVERREETRDTVTLLLEPRDGVPLRHAAGQFTMLEAFGVGEVPISISGDPTRVGLLEHTVRDVGAVTRALVRSGPGDVLGVRGPYGTGWGVADGAGADVVIVAGGIGLAPLRSALLEVLSRRADFGRVALLIGARRPGEVLFADQLARWTEDVDVHVTVDVGAPGWEGRVGLVTSLLPLVDVDPQQTLALVCGPEVMMRFVATALLDRGVPPSRVRLSMERNMRCGTGLCGHCQLRELFLCVDGPVLSYERLAPLMAVREL